MVMKKTLETINQLQADGVIGQYAIGGAVGATFYLEPAATLDVDIFVVLPVQAGSSILSLGSIYEYLTARGCKIQGEHVLIGTWPVQFLPPADKLENEALLEAREVKAEGVSTWVMTAEHLAAIALKTGRPKDFNRILQFLEQDALDKDRFEQIVTKHELTAKWQQFREKYLNE
jgi:hypothetical protein